ncbi:hypothetical protein ACFSQQ_31820 [Mesorhizobium kowhaii]
MFATTFGTGLGVASTTALRLKLVGDRRLQRAAAVLERLAKTIGKPA